MMHPATLQALLEAGLPCQHVAVDGDGRHFTALLVSAEFEGKSRVARQQRAYACLREQLDSGELHAISLQTLTPLEWSASRG